jgi:uncharacterized protein (DUF983 family)
MASNPAALETSTAQKCAFCAEPILADAKKCKHCGEFVSSSVSKRVLALFAAGVMIACVVAGMQTRTSEGVLAVGVWAIFALMFARMFVRS